MATADETVMQELVMGQSIVLDLMYRPSATKSANFRKNPLKWRTTLVKMGNGQPVSLVDALCAAQGAMLCAVTASGQSSGRRQSAAHVVTTWQGIWTAIGMWDEADGGGVASTGTTLAGLDALIVPDLTNPAAIAEWLG